MHDWAIVLSALMGSIQLGIQKKILLQGLRRTHMRIRTHRESHAVVRQWPCRTNLLGSTLAHTLPARRLLFDIPYMLGIRPIPLRLVDVPIRKYLADCRSCVQCIHLDLAILHRKLPCHTNLQLRSGSLG